MASSLIKTAQEYAPTWHTAVAVGAAVIIGKVSYRYFFTGKKSLPPCALDPEHYSKCKLTKVTPVSHNSAM